jgi:(p)ppGpp synthase/HD superfamily hydrolase
MPNSTTPNLLDNAALLALKWHSDQTRKGDGKPYLVHILGVATNLAKHGFSDETIAAGYCHDLLEDTACPEQDIIDACGEEVLATVKAVSNDESLSWEEKKKKYIETVRAGSEAAKAVCLVDKMHNMQSLINAHAEQGDALWAKFNRGKKEKLWFEEAVLEMLKETWKHPLLKEYEAMIEKMRSL